MVGKISEDDPCTALTGAEIIAAVQGGLNKQLTPDMIAVFLKGQFVQVLSRQNGGDTNNSASGSGSYKDHNLTFVIPANFLTANKVLRVTAQYKMTTGSAPPVLTHRVTIGGVTVVENDVSAAPPVSLTNRQLIYQYEIQALATPSASSAIEAGILGAGNSSAAPADQNIVATPVNLATNSALTLVVGTKWATAGTGTSTMQLTRLNVEAL